MPTRSTRRKRGGALTAYDHDSIMNFCRNSGSGNFYDLPIKLSDADKVGLKTLSECLNDQTDENIGFPRASQVLLPA